MHVHCTVCVFFSLKIDQVNKYLDQVAQSNIEHKREDVKKALQLLLRNTSALEQVLSTFLFGMQNIFDTITAGSTLFFFDFLRFSLIHVIMNWIIFSFRNG